MGIGATDFAAMVNESNYDSDFSLLFNQSYQKLSSEDALSTSCLNLPSARLTLVQSLYSRMLNGTVSASLISALYPLTSAALLKSYYSWYSSAELVNLSLAMELGIRNSLDQLVNGTQKPTQTPFGCVGVVLEALNVSSGAFKYRLRTEYDPTLDPSQGSFLDQSSARSTWLRFDRFHNVLFIKNSTIRVFLMFACSVRYARDAMRHVHCLAPLRWHLLSRRCIPAESFRGNSDRSRRGLSSSMANCAF